MCKPMNSLKASFLLFLGYTNSKCDISSTSNARQQLLKLGERDGRSVHFAEGDVEGRKGGIVSDCF